MQEMVSLFQPGWKDQLQFIGCYEAKFVCTLPLPSPSVNMSINVFQFKHSILPLFAQTEVWGVRLCFQKLLQLNVVHKLWIYYGNQIVKERKPQSGTDIILFGVIVAFQQTFLESRRSSWALPSSLHTRMSIWKAFCQCFPENNNPFLSFKVLNPNCCILPLQFLLM